MSATLARLTVRPPPLATATRAQALADGAVRALVAEAMLTPKPALVDQRGCGAHRDLTLTSLLRSARALRASFHGMALAAESGAADLALREQLVALGRSAERRMLVATSGSNAHRGAIWVIGLLVASLARLPATRTLSEVAALAARLARLPDRHSRTPPSNGARACRRFGVGGARGSTR